MILARTDRGVRFVTQPDHAALAGRLAELWGGETFDFPEPTAAVRLAVHAHDDGWRPYDRRPRLDPDGSPRAFHELPPDEWLCLYRRGIDEVARADRYAGLLVSMHGAGLRRRRYGLSPSWGETPSAFRSFVETEQQRQRSLATAIRDDPDDCRLAERDADLLERLHEAGRAPAGVRAGGPEPAPTTPAAADAADPRLWRNYRLLVGLDVLSLRLCSTADAEAPVVVEPVPTTPDAPDATLTATPVEPETYELSPYPFRESPATVRVPARTVDLDGVTAESTLVDRFYEADTEALSIALRPA